MGLIFLTGMPGVGKTTVGRELAGRMVRTFRDLDGEIESKTGKSIREIFSISGEDSFRDIEAQTLTELCRQTDAVIALGGGTLERTGNRQLIAATGKMVYLHADIELLVERNRGMVHRPLLSGARESGELRELLQDLLLRRETAYRSAEITVDVKPEHHGSDVVDEILERLGPD